MKRWGQDAQTILERDSGRVPAAKIAQETGFSERTILERQRLAGLGAYAHRPKWTRRDYLMAGSACWFPAYSLDEA